MIKENSSFFVCIDNEIKAYWFGFFCADGHLYKNGKQISILLSSKDRNHLEKFANIFSSSLIDGKTCDFRTKKQYTNSRCVVYGKKICEDLKNKSLDNHKSKTLSSKVFDFIPKSLLHHFIRGYFDGDGCISNNHKKEFIFNIAGTEKFLEKVKEIFIKEIKINQVKVLDCKSVYALSIGGNWQILKIKEWLYNKSTIFLERKKAIFDKINFGRLDKKSSYRGVGWDVRDKKWKARIFVKGKNYWLGTFNNEKQAAKAYDDGVVKFGLPLYKKNFS